MHPYSNQVYKVYFLLKLLLHGNKNTLDPKQFKVRLYCFFVRDISDIFTHKKKYRDRQILGGF